MAKTDWNIEGSDGAGTGLALGPINLFYSVTEAGLSKTIHLPEGINLGDAHFIRDGNDLRVFMEAGDELRIQNYFVQLDPPDLLDLGGGKADGRLVEAFLEGGQLLHLAQAGNAGSTLIGKVSALAGKVFVVRGDGSRVELNENAQMFQNDVVETQAGASVRITFLDGSNFALGGDGRMALTQHIFDPASQTGKSVTSILKGVFVFTSGKIADSNKGDMTVNTPVAQIGIRGTKAAGDVKAPGETSTFTIIEGAIILINNGGIMLLDQEGFSTRVVNFETSPSARFVITDAQAVILYGAVTPVARQLLQQFFDGRDPSPGDQGQGDPGQGTIQQALLIPLSENLLTSGFLVNKDLLADPLGYYEITDGLSIFDIDGDGLVLALLQNDGTINVIFDSDVPLDEIIEILFDAPVITVNEDGIIVTGTPAADSITGTPGPDILSGSDGNDVIDGGAGNDIIEGGNGDDILTGGAGDDVVLGGPGNDRLIAGQGEGNDFYDGQDGIDSLEYPSAVNDLDINMLTGITVGGPEIGTDVFFNIEDIIAGQGNDTITVDVNDNEIDGGNGTDTVVFSGNSGAYVFAPDDGEIVVSGGGDGTDTLTNVEILRFTDKDIPTIQIADATVSEGNVLSFTVTLGAVVTSAVTVDYTIMGLTATGGTDYTILADGTLTFNAGVTTQTLNIATLQDAFQENTETLNVTLSNVTGPGVLPAVLADTTGVGTITDDDGSTTLSISDGVASPGPEGEDIIFTVNLSAAAGEDINVDFVATSGSAISGVDYTATAGTLTILAGATSGFITVPTTGDVTVEGTETFTVDLSNAVFDPAGTPSALVITDASGAGSITENVTLSIGDGTPSPTNEGGIVTFTVTLSALSASKIDVDFTTVAGSATAGTDFVAVTSTLSILAGSISGDIMITTLAEPALEGNETFTVNLTNARIDPLSDNILTAITDASGTGTIADPPDVVSLQLSTLSANQGFRMDGVFTGDSLGSDVGMLTDFNGDGLADLLVGASKYDNTSLIDAGAVYVVFGSSSFGATFDLSTITVGNANGIVLRGNDAGGLFGFAVGGASSDIDGDGFSDLLGGGPFYSGDGQYGVGYSLLGYAGATSTPVDTSGLSGTDGFKLSGETLSAYASAIGWAISGAGDVNGDGIEDFVVGDPSAHNGGPSPYGAVYLIYGKSTFFATETALGLSDETGTLFSNVATDGVGSSVIGGGDFNGDGYADIMFGTSISETYIVYGNKDGLGGTFSLPSLTSTEGVKLSGNGGSNAGEAIAFADINGDGFADAIIADSTYDPNTRTDAGSVYVLFGSASEGAAVDLTMMGLPSGFRIDGATASDYFGGDVARAGDFNGDGYEDIIVLAKGEDTAGIDYGAAYIIFGAASFSANIDLLTASGATALRIEGLTTNSLNSGSVSGGEDINGDGFDDVVIGASLYYGTNDGSAFVVYGYDVGGTVTHQGTTGADNLSGTAGADVMIGGLGDDIVDGNGGADSLRGGAGNDTLTINDLAFLDIDGGGGNDLLILSASGTTFDFTATNYRVSDIEKIDIGGFGAGNHIKLSTLDVTNMSSSFNQLIIGGDPGDQVTLVGDFAYMGIVNESGTDYHKYVDGQATVLIELNMQVAIPSLDIGELNPDISTRLIAGTGGAQAGYSVSLGPDINGDGLDDFVVGMPNGSIEGTAYGVLGGASLGYSVSMHSINGTDGFRLDGRLLGDQNGYNVAMIGDVDGDGFGDVLSGAPSYDYSVDNDVGEAYIVFGDSSTFPDPVDPADFGGSDGTRILGGGDSYFLGWAVAGNGDINGDGIGDFMISQPGAYSSAGLTHVVFGLSSGFPGAAFNISTLDGTTGIDIQGESATDYSGFSLAIIGDINSDGFDDFMIGAPYATGANVNSGAGYLIYGKGTAFTDPLLLASMGSSDGFSINGLATNDAMGWSVAAGGDINGDGYADMLVSAYKADPSARAEAGSTYVIFGSASSFGTNFDVTTLIGSNGFRIDGAVAGDYAGFSISSAGDFNGDGYDDIIIGAPNATADGKALAGSAYIIFGNASNTWSATFDLASIDGTNGIRLDGAYAGDKLGYSVGGGGDIDGDGFDDVIVGAPDADYDSGLSQGMAYVVYGGSFTGEVDQIGTSGADTLTGTGGSDILIGAQGNDRLVGAGGSDILIGGSGDDTLVVTGSTFLRLDGGTGDDTWELVQSFTASNVKAETIRSVETIDMKSGAGADAYTLVLDADFIQNVTDQMDPIASMANAIVVDGDGSDTLTLSGFTNMGTVATGYTAYTDSATLATAVVNDAIGTVNI